MNRIVLRSSLLVGFMSLAELPASQRECAQRPEVTEPQEGVKNGISLASDLKVGETRFEARVKEGERPRSRAEVRDLAIALIEAFGGEGGLLSGSRRRVDVDERKRSEKERRTAGKRGGRSVCTAGAELDWWFFTN